MQARLNPFHASPGYYSKESKTTRAAIRLKGTITSHAAEDPLLLGAFSSASCSLKRCGGVYRTSSDALSPRLPAAAFGMPLEDFRARFSLLSLHLWMVLVRLRSEGDPGRELGQARATPPLYNISYGHVAADL